MTSDAEIRALIERLRQYEGRNWENTLCYNGVRDEAASALSALLEERNKAREYGGQARIRENKAEDARISAQTRIADLEQKLAKARALEPTVEFVARMAWRSDPPNANNPFTPAERFNAIQWHPTIREYGKPHRELAAKEALK